MVAELGKMLSGGQYKVTERYKGCPTHLSLSAPKPQIPSTASDLAEYPAFAASTYEEFSDYSSLCNLFVSLKYFFYHSIANVTAL